MLRPAWSVARLAILQADEPDFSRSKSERLIEHPKIDVGKRIFASWPRSQIMRHSVPSLDSLLDPEKLLAPMFAGEVDGFFEELLLHEWQVDFHANSALQTGLDKEQIAAASAARNRHISGTRA